MTTDNKSLKDSFTKHLKVEQDLSMLLGIYKSVENLCMYILLKSGISVYLLVGLIDTHKLHKCIVQVSMVLRLVNEQVDFATRSSPSKTILKSATDERLSLFVNDI